VDASLSASAALRTTTEGNVEAHIVDPKSGQLVRAPRASFAVSPSATDAEVLSTALIVARADGRDFVRRFPRAVVAVLETGRPRWSMPEFPWEEAVDEESAESP
jgi:thiamine biosynthesis lipoprotein ApbE